MTNNALLIIDVQKGFINEYTRELPGKIEKLQNNYANVYAMQFINLEDSMFRKQLNWHKLSLNTQDSEKIRRLGNNRKPDRVRKINRNPDKATMVAPCFFNSRFT